MSEYTSSTPTGGNSPGKFNSSGGPGEIKYISIAKVNEAHLLLTVPGPATKKAYAEEVKNTHIALIFYHDLRFCK